ncbi:MAG: transposase [Candidatus Saccharimonadales bacterium]|jgi:transposase
MEGQRLVFAEDECHLLWGDTTGYVWGQRNEKTEVPIQNIKQRQTYYGALNLYRRDFVLVPHDAGNGENTVAFLKHLHDLNQNKKLTVIWDGASYHCSEEVKAYLNKVNEGLDEKDWKMTCLLFAPNAPEQNPVEDVWLKGKNFLRRNFYQNKTFRHVKNSFFDFLNKQTFAFNKIEWYLNFSQSV